MLLLLFIPLQAQENPDSLIRHTFEKGRELFQEGKYFEAEQLVLEEIELRKSYHPDELAKLATVYSNISLVYIALRRYEDALKFINIVEEIQEQLNLQDNRMIRTYYQKSAIYSALGDIERSERYLQQCINLNL